MNSLRRVILATFALAFFAGPTRADNPDPAAVLERFVGTWNTHTHIRHFGPTPREFDTRGKADCRPTLGGRYYEFRSESIPPGESDLQIMTYDADARVYRQWVFSSDGYTHEATGTWNSATSTLRWTGKSPDAIFTIDDRWVSDEKLEWTLKRTDLNGNLLQTIDGSLERSMPESR